MRVHVGPLRLPVSSDPEDQLGSLRLRLFQAQLRRCAQRRVLLEAPTASGKSLAYLVRALRPIGGVERPFGTTIIVYPTNALMWDQAYSLYELLTQKLGVRVNLTVESDTNIRWRTTTPNAEVDLYVLNGETLGALAKEKQSSEGKAIVEQLRANQAESRIILTNPEVLYYVSLFRFARNEDLIEELFYKKPPSLLVFDEFHLYHGYSLATITYMLAYIKNMFDQIVFGSATPIDLEKIIHEGYHTIRAEPSGDGELVRHPLELEFRGADLVLGPEHVPTIKELVDQHYGASKNRDQAVKVLVILSSVMTCLRLQEVLEEAYPGQVTAIHGLVPPNARPHSRSDFKPIVVGTSAIEVGVDFDAASLIVEAPDYKSFIQRLGRGARHGESAATVLVSHYDISNLKKEIPDGSSLDPQELNARIKRSLPDLPAYSDFALSGQAAPILLAILINWVIQRPAGGKPLNDGEILRQTSEIFEKGLFKIPDELKPLENHVGGALKNASAMEIRLARSMSCRNTFESIPAVFTFIDPPQFDLISLQELTKIHIKYPVKAEELIARGIKIPWKMRVYGEFVEVVATRQRQAKVKVEVPDENRFHGEPAPLTRFQVEADDGQLEDAISKIIRGQPAYILWEKKDWRLQGLYTPSREFLAVGGDAYLAWYISKGLSGKSQRP